MPHPFPQSKKVLIADDSALERRRLASVIRTLGLEPIEVADSSEVMDGIRTEKPLLILLDVVMPPPNGFELCRQIQKDPVLRLVPIVMCSVKATEVDHMWARKMGVCGYLAKPFDPERARIFLSSHLNRIYAASAHVAQTSSGEGAHG